MLKTDLTPKSKWGKPWLVVLGLEISINIIDLAKWIIN
jgi:hypothetical protein